MKTLVAIPVLNEEKHAERVLNHVLEHVGNVLVIDDGSTDATPAILARYPVDVIRHCVNRGYGRSLIDAFAWADVQQYDWVITMDCDEQHEPRRIPEFLADIERGGADIVSGSRYFNEPKDLSMVPGDRRRINKTLTGEINDRFGWALTDSFCGFKAHRVAAMRKLRLTETGYAFPMQLWAQAAAAGLRIRELPVDLIYNDPNRTFGAALNDPEVRLAHYRDVLEREIAASAGWQGMVELPRLSKASRKRAGDCFGGYCAH